jgi:hypothetical protein
VTMAKLLRTLRLDLSDTFVFDRAAAPGEWAVTGSILFRDADPAAMGPKDRAAFRAGFLGLASFGLSTLVEVAEIEPGQRSALIETFAHALVERFGAPNFNEASQAARDEIDFAASLCDHDPGTVIAMQRTFDDSEIRERFRTLHRRDPSLAGADRLHAFARAFEVVETEEPRETEEPQEPQEPEEREERVDMLELMESKPTEWTNG